MKGGEMDLFTGRGRMHPFVGRRSPRVVASVAALLFASLLLAGLAGASAGGLDPSFGQGRGTVVIDAAPQGGGESAQAVVVQSDGRIVVAGQVFRPGGGSDAEVFRLQRNGRLDDGFGRSGVVFTHVPNSFYNFPADVAVQSDGKIVVGETGTLPGAHFVLLRYTQQGTLDPSFGTDGVVVTEFHPGIADDYLRAIAIQPDGKIVAVGQTRNYVTTSDFAIARYNSDGSLDSSFGVAGRVVIDFGGLDFALKAAIQGDGKILVAGGGRSVPPSTPLLVRLEPNGSLDYGFGSGGVVDGDFAGWFDDVKVQGGDGIVAHAPCCEPPRLLRYKFDGAVDPTFGTGGSVPIQDAGGAVETLVRPDGRIVLVDYLSDPPDFVLHGYTRDGRLDPDFGVDGVIVANVAPKGASAFASDGALQADGKVVVAGWVTAGSRSASLVARFKNAK